MTTSEQRLTASDLTRPGPIGSANLTVVNSGRELWACYNCLRLCQGMFVPFGAVPFQNLTSRDAFWASRSMIQLFQPGQVQTVPLVNNWVLKTNAVRSSVAAFVPVNKWSFLRVAVHGFLFQSVPDALLFYFFCLIPFYEAAPFCVLLFRSTQSLSSPFRSGLEYFLIYVHLCECLYT